MKFITANDWDKISEQAMKEGKDACTQASEYAYNVEYENVTSEQRNVTKLVVMTYMYKIMGS